MTKPHLKADQKEFLKLVTLAAFANPFSDERNRLDQQISGRTGITHAKVPLEPVLAQVQKILTAITSERRHFTAYPPEEQKILQYAHLFDTFHQFADKFDSLIQTQIKSGEESCTVPFARDLFTILVNRGFTDKDALRYFAMFYQLRRAFYFINSLLLGQGKSMKQLRVSLWNNVFTHDIQLYEKHLWNHMEDFSTLLLGETGTGKGTAATAIGRSGFIPFDEKKNSFTESFMRSFVAINLSQFPESLIESELFGHRKGAFTGAVEAHEGIFARCSPHGALFLDEIGDVSIPIQIKLLHVLQERTFSPVGSHEKTRFHGRVIAASNRSIDDLRCRNLFRNDFYYRLCSDVITLPSLEQRLQEEPDELNDLLSVTILRITGQSDAELVVKIRKAIAINPGQNYSWPGNVRELEQCVRRILLTRRYSGDTANVPGSLKQVIKDGIDSGSYNAEDLMADYTRMLYERFGTYEDLARHTCLDRRTVKKYILKHQPPA